MDVAATAAAAPIMLPPEDTVGDTVKPPAILQIDQLISPNALTDLKENLQTLRLTIITNIGGSAGTSTAAASTTIDITVFPFDTIDDIKSKIFIAMRSELKYLPKFLFLGLPIRRTQETDESAPITTDQYQALDYLWYPPGITSESQNLILYLLHLNNSMLEQNQI